MLIFILRTRPTTPEVMKTLLTAFMLMTVGNTLTGLAQVSAPQRGFQPAGSYAIGDIESINTVGGNLMLDIPLASLPQGRGGLSAGLRLLYNSKIWDPSSSVYPGQNGQQQSFTHLAPSPDGGWRFGFVYKVHLYNRRDQYKSPYYSGPSCPGAEAYNIYQVKMSFPDGGTHEFRPMGYDDTGRDGWFYIRPDGWQAYCRNWGGSPASYSLDHSLATAGIMTYYSVDGSYLRLDVQHDADADPHNNSWTLYKPDGTRVAGAGLRNEAVTSSGSATNRITDRNENYIQIQRPGNNTTKIVDQLDRAITIVADTSAPQHHIYASGANGRELKWTVKWKTITVNKTYYSQQYPDAGLTTLTYPLIVVDEVILPEQAGGLGYTFNYNSEAGNPSPGWGEVSSVTLPSGARASYTYKRDGGNSLGFEAVLKNYPTRKVLTYAQEYDGDSTESTETWQYRIGHDYTTAVTSSSITNPAGGVTNQYFNDTQVSLISVEKGLVYKTEQPDGTVVERLWQQNRPWYIDRDGRLASPSGGANPYVKTEFTSIRDSGGSLVKTAIRDYNYDKNGNVTQVAEYDWVRYVDVPRDGQGRPYAAPPNVQPKRVTVSAYYSPTPDASDTTTNDPDRYHLATSPRLRTALESVEVRSGFAGGTALSRSEFVYDDAATRGNLNLQKNWDSTRGALQRPLAAGTFTLVSHEYDNFGNLTLTTDAGRADGSRTQTQYVYGPVSGPNGSITGLYPTEIVIAPGTPVSLTTRQEYDFWTGLVIRTTDVENDVSTLTDYDALGRPKLVTTAEYKLEETRTAMEYADALRRVIVRTDLASAGDARLVSVTHYDQLGRVRLTRQIEDSSVPNADTDESIGIKVQTRYKTVNPCHPDNTPECVAANLQHMATYQLVSNPYRAAHSSEAGGETTMGWTVSTSDRGGRGVEVKTFEGTALPAPWGANATSTGAVRTAYNAQTTTITDQAGKSRKSVVNGLGQLAQVFEGPADSGYNYQTDYAYDALSNLTQTVQSGRAGQAGQTSQTRTFAYSSLSRLVSTMNPESGAVGYEYDASGNLTKKTDARGVRTDYEYDALNRRTLRNYSDQTPDVTYSYDAAGVAYSRGRLTSVGSSVSTSSYTSYDALGRVTGSSQAISGQTYTMAYQYDLAGGLKSQTYPSGRVVTTEYDPAGRVAGVHNQATGLYYAGAASTDAANRIQYAAHGATSEVKLGNNLWEHTAFNSRLQQTEIGLGSSSANSSKLQLVYGYGQADKNNGNLRSQRILIDGLLDLTQTYDYDSVNRLSWAREAQTADDTQTWKQSFTYLDQNSQNGQFGNRRLDPNNTTANVMPPQNPQIDPQDNRFGAGQGYAYDPAGNLTNEPGGRTYSYDAENRLTLVNGGLSSGVGVEYSYDGDGRRVRKATTAETTVFVYDAMGKLVAEYSNQTTGVGTSYLTQDMLGSTRAVTGADGQPRSRHDYLPFGEELQAGVGGRTASQGYSQFDGMRQRYTQKARDIDTNLDYFGARYYSSTQGRFISPDSLAGSMFNPQELNLYSYVRNSPLKYIDPTGHSAQDPKGPKPDPQPYDPDCKCYPYEDDLIIVVDNQKGDEAVRDHTFGWSRTWGSYPLGTLMAPAPKWFDPFSILPGGGIISKGSKPARGILTKIVSWLFQRKVLQEASVTIGGITAKQAARLRELLEAIPGVRSVGAFGSRTKGTFTKESDLDIILFGEVNHSDPATVGAVRQAQDYAREIGIGLGKEGRAPLDIHVFGSRRELERSFRNAYSFDPSQGVPTIVPIE